MVKSYWLFKSEPETYSFSQLLQEGKTHWNGVRNFQARNYLKEVQLGDLALIYHSGGDKAVVGVAEVIRTHYPDPDPNKAGDWVQIDIQPKAQFLTPVTLAQIKNTPALKDILLIKQSRLSVMPILPKHFEIICQLGGVK